MNRPRVLFFVAALFLLGAAVLVVRKVEISAAQMISTETTRIGNNQFFFLSEASIPLNTCPGWKRIWRSQVKFECVEPGFWEFKSVWKEGSMSTSPSLVKV